MNISPNNPLKPESQRVWEKITTEHIEAEISRYIGMDNVEELVVVLNLNSQEPPFISASPTVTPTGAPSSSFTEVPTNPDQVVITNIMRSGTRGYLDVLKRRRTQDANLNIGFSVDVLVRSTLQAHVINHYIGGAFDTADDRQRYLKALALADPASESAQRLNVVLPDPPPESIQLPSSRSGYGMIAGLVGGSSVFTALLFFLVYKRRQVADIKNDTLLEIECMNDHICSEIEWMSGKCDISTLGDPIPMFSRAIQSQLQL
jgi:hypothetical protein